jgi:hypothetical protein
VPGPIIDLLRSISSVLRTRSFSYILYPVIYSVSILVIQLSLGPETVPQHPNYDMRFIDNAADSDKTVASLFMKPSRYFTSMLRIPVIAPVRIRKVMLWPLPPAQLPS